MAPSKIKLTYFDGQGRGEISRLVLASSKKTWEDNRIEFADWPALKPKTPMGSLPVLEVDGKSFSQGIAIATYLAKEFGLHGANNVEGLAIDQIQLIREDLLTQEAKMTFEKDEAKKAEVAKKLNEEDYPKIMGFFNDAVKNNPTKSGFSVGKKLSVADIAIYVGTENLQKNVPELFGKFPELKALRAKVAQTEGIKQYLATRKETPF